MQSPVALRCSRWMSCFRNEEIWEIERIFSGFSPWLFFLLGIGWPRGPETRTSRITFRSNVITLSHFWAGKFSEFYISIKKPNNTAICVMIYSNIRVLWSPDMTLSFMFITRHRGCWTSIPYIWHIFPDAIKLHDQHQQSSSVTHMTEERKEGASLLQ